MKRCSGPFHIKRSAELDSKEYRFRSLPLLFKKCAEHCPGDNEQGHGKHAPHHSLRPLSTLVTAINLAALLNPWTWKAPAAASTGMLVGI
jgi:hypothetical protein